MARSVPSVSSWVATRWGDETMGRRWEDFVSPVYSKILPLIPIIVVIVGGIGFLFQGVFLKIEIAGVGESLWLIAEVVILTLVVVTLFAFYQIALSKDIRDLLDERLPRSGGNPNNREEERIETSGAGALGGMVVGGVLGLIFGPVGVIVGGSQGHSWEIKSSMRVEDRKERKEGSLGFNL